MSDIFLVLVILDVVPCVYVPVLFFVLGTHDGVFF